MESEKTTWFIIALLAAGIGLIVFFEWPVVWDVLTALTHPRNEPETTLDILSWCALFLVALPAITVAVVLRLRSEKSERAEWDEFQAWKKARGNG